jgi:hypothetical protein
MQPAVEGLVKALQVGKRKCFFQHQAGSILPDCLPKSLQSALVSSMEVRQGLNINNPPQVLNS